MTEQAIETLKLLGLTSIQARVYISLLRTRSTKIKDLAKFSNVSRPDMYRVINDLKRRGLVEEEITSPTIIKAIPLRDCVETLLQNRNSENERIEKKATELLKNQNDKLGVEYPENTDSRFFLIPSTRAIKKIGQTIETAQKSIDLIITWNRLFQGLEFFSGLNKKALARKVKFRTIVEKPQKEMARGIEFFGHPFYEIKYSLFEPSVILGIYDGMQVSIAANPKVELHDSPLLWSNNSALVALAVDYFEKSWYSGKSLKIQDSGRAHRDTLNL